MVRLRPLAAEDRDKVRAWRNQPHVAAMMYTDHVIGAEEHARWFAATLIDPTKRYFIIKAGDEDAGLAGFTEIEGGSASWAFYLASAETRGRGMGAETEFLMLCYAFETLGLETLRCEVLVRNAPVIAMHEGFGFSRTGILVGRAIKNGAPEDVQMLSMAASNWPAAKARAFARLEERRLRRSA
jgi:UDP-4-amino-4,6-dideoxy-N-acetyl-beta-L-altrosamine N-acetyltransferase